MFGVEIDGLAIMLSDSKITVNNISRIEYTLNKKHSSIDYHLVCKKFSARVPKIGWILTTDNVTDALTKILTEAKRKKLFSDWTY